MADNPQVSQSFMPEDPRDGTSQADRIQTALMPDYVAIDERRYADMLAFARDYAKQLRFYNADGTVGTWDGFIGNDVDLDALVAYMEDPANTAANEAYQRPHFALFLSFLKLLRVAQTQMNQLTKRHLEFYYQQVLKLTQQGSIPDTVNVLVDIADDVAQLWLPAGTELAAGSDSSGQALIYTTDDDIVVNHAQVQELRALYAHKALITLRSARENRDVPREEAFMDMMRLVYGDPLPAYDNGVQFDYDGFIKLKNQVDFVGFLSDDPDSGLFFEFAEFRSLIMLKQRRDNSDAEWDTINALLTKAARQRTGNANFELNLSDKRDFAANFAQAIGAVKYDGVTEVNNVYDAYEQQIRSEVKEKIIRDQLYFSDVNDFLTLMQTKIRIENEWAEIARLLQLAGQRKRDDDSYRLTKPEPELVTDSSLGRDYPNPPRTDFDGMMAEALGEFSYPPRTDDAAIADLDAFYARLMALEAYFYMEMEDFAYVMRVATDRDAEAFALDAVYDQLTKSHQAKVYAARLAALQQMRVGQGYIAMLNYALGELAPPNENDALNELELYVARQEDMQFLQSIAAQVQSDETVSAEDWERVYKIVEQAQRSILPTPIPQYEVWKNLYPREDVTQSTVTLGVAGESDNERWKTFGQRQVDDTVHNPLPLTFGWAVSSPLLWLSEGQRTLFITLAFERESYDAEAISALLNTTPLPFVMQVSTEAGWLEPEPDPDAETPSIAVVDYAVVTGADPGEEQWVALRFTLSFAENAPAIVAPSLETHGIASPDPVLRLMLRQTWQPYYEGSTRGNYITPYTPFKRLVLRRTHLLVDVKGLLPARLQNDETELNPKKPFEPFGFDAPAGARFYIAHPELIRKQLGRLQFNMQWMKAPANINNHYANYPQQRNIQRSGFTVRVGMVDERLEVALSNNERLFRNQGNTALSSSIMLADVGSAAAQLRRNYVYQRADELFTDSTDIQDWNRFFQWELNTPDFQHSVYNSVSTQKALELAAAASADEAINAANFQVNAPYTPQIKALTIDYTSAEEILLTEYEQGYPERIFHMQPFGYNEVRPIAGRTPFLPQYDNEGELLIGIAGVNAPQNLSLLFQMAEGSADPDLTPFPVRWHVLSGNEWLSLEDGNLLSDTTRGFINSGIVKFALDPARANTLLPPDLYWIRASIERNSNSICDTVAIHTQAVAATFVDNNNAPDHLSRPLAAKSIADLALPDPAVSGIRQPYTSFGGKVPEADARFYTRISERLRHKNRALTMWDYEHLVLQAFPDIYKVKCLPAQPDNPGMVTVIVIPDIRNKLPFNPFEPKASTDVIADIQEFVATITPAYASVRVKNAHYSAVKLRFAVRFRAGYNEGFYRQQLNEDINRFLSPWAYEDSADIVIGGRVYANVIINFIDTRPYVDYVSNLKLFRSDDGEFYEYIKPGYIEHPYGARDDKRKMELEVYWVQAPRPDGVLVAARQHEIDMITDAGYEDVSFEGINYMKIELDFVVA